MLGRGLVRVGRALLFDVLALAGPLPEARYVRVCAGEYVVPLALEQADLALLCDRLDG